MRIPESLIVGLRDVPKPESTEEAFRLFCLPVRTQPLKREQELLADAREFQIQCNGQEIVVNEWGTGDPILFVHGWGGRGTQFSNLISATVEHGFTAVAFDGPGHGRSEGEFCTGLLMAEIVGELSQKYGPFAAIVCHSFGAIGVNVAISRGTQAAKVVYLAPLIDIVLRCDQFAAAAGMSDEETREFWKLIDAEFGEGTLSRLSGDALAPGFEMPGLVIHDPEDNDIWPEEILRFVENHPNAEFVAPEGVGHLRILRDRSIHQKVCQFLFGNNTGV